MQIAFLIPSSISEDGALSTSQQGAYGSLILPLMKNAVATESTAPSFPTSAEGLRPRVWLRTRRHPSFLVSEV
jgi:hypothetical protein